MAVIKTIYISFSFKWNEKYVEEYREKHDVRLPHPEFIPHERNEKELHKNVLFEITKSIFTDNKSLLFYDQPCKTPRLEWGFNVDYDGNISVVINSDPCDEWNDEVIEQAIIFLHTINNIRDCIKQDIKITSNVDLRTYDEISDLVIYVNLIGSRYFFIPDFMNLSNKCKLK